MAVIWMSSSQVTEYVRLVGGVSAGIGSDLSSVAPLLSVTAGDDSGEYAGTSDEGISDGSGDMAGLLHALSKIVPTAMINKTSLILI